MKSTFDWFESTLDGVAARVGLWISEGSIAFATSLAVANIFEKLRIWSRRRKYREGETVSRFIARDIRRDILVVSVARIDEGVISARVRTTNVLYLAKGHVLRPEFGPVTELPFDEMWRWTGQSSGGLPDGTSIADHVGRE